jgi:hypothetical protein
MGSIFRIVRCSEDRRCIDAVLGDQRRNIYFNTSNNREGSKNSQKLYVGKFRGRCGKFYMGKILLLTSLTSMLLGKVSMFSNSPLLATNNFRVS